MKPNENQEQTVSIAASEVESIYCLQKWVAVSYEPMEDITAYEVAKLIPLFVSREPLTENALEALGTAARHLKRHT